MDKDYIKYILRRIDSAINDYTTMSREDIAEYVLAYIEYLMEDRESE